MNIDNEKMITDPLPPKPRLKSSPKDVFMHLLAIGVLYVSVVSFIALLHQYINIIFPDLLNYYYYTGALNTILWSTSALIVVFPTYLLLSWLLNRDIAREPEKKELRIRRWLIYFTLFISAITIIVDLISLIYNFLGGELTIRFLLKVLVILLITAAVFGFYIWDLRRKEVVKSKKTKTIAWITSAVVLISITGGFFITGTPAHQRQVRLDERRVNDLQMIQNEIVNYWTQKGELPESLNDLENSITGFKPPKDPETNAPYEYRIIDPLTFELCAVFETSTSHVIQSFKGIPESVAPYYDPYQQNWNHDEGLVCFTRKIDPELFKPQTRD
ncbi:MAG: DUF5671 domain-containing protein [Actinobacteria bacterium]|nr:DUF5671 domain-containing protein [Actinomycetota bacterium]